MLAGIRGVLAQAGFFTTLAADAASGDQAWVELLPTGEFMLSDGRGPYRVVDAKEVARVSIEEAAGRSLPVDYDHAIDYAAPRGGAAPAAGWIAAIEPRAGSLWGLAAWTARASAALKALEYRHLSPVFQHRADGTVVRILRAALTNNPALPGMLQIASATSASAAPVAAALDHEAIARRAQVRQEQARASGSPITAAEAVRLEIAAGAASPGREIDPTAVAFEARRLVSELGTLGIRIELHQAVLQVIGRS